MQYNWMIGAMWIAALYASNGKSDWQSDLRGVSRSGCRLRGIRLKDISEHDLGNSHDNEPCDGNDQECLDRAPSDTPK
jgi:hypothetical protein